MQGRLLTMLYFLSLSSKIRLAVYARINHLLAYQADESQILQNTSDYGHAMP